MNYFQPYIDETGIHIPGYTDIRDYLLAQAQALWPSGYFGEDSQDYEYISIVAQTIYDSLQAVQLAFNNYGAAAAVGAGQDALYKLNGISRNGASFSTRTVTCVGAIGTEINNGVVIDTNGNNWDLPVLIIIPGAGTVDVSATCETPGAITAPAGEALNINNPTAGWTGATGGVASPGQPQMSDSAFRVLQAASVARPSMNLIAGTIATIAGIAGVTRWNIFENPTGAVDSFGTPAHSITCVVEGGADLDVATAIYQNKGPGPLTNGTTTVPVTDPTYGTTTDINFYRPSYITPYVIINLHALAGYTSVIGQAVVTAVVNYLNSLSIGEEISWSALFAAAYLATPNITRPLFSLTSLYLGTAPAPTGVVDLSVNFNQVSQGVAANITLNTV